MDLYTEPDFAASALITIDVQRDVLDGGALAVPGTTAVLPAIELLLGAFRAADRPIVHMVRLYQADGTDVDLSRRARLEAGEPLLLAGSPGSQLAPGLLLDPGTELDAERLLLGLPQRIGPAEVVVFKPRWGAFYRTSLAQHLEGVDVNTLVFCGANFPNCPRTSIYEASERDFRTVLVTDAVSVLSSEATAELGAIGVALFGAGDVAAALH